MHTIESWEKNDTHSLNQDLIKGEDTEHVDQSKRLSKEVKALFLWAILLTVTGVVSCSKHTDNQQPSLNYVVPNGVSYRVLNDNPPDVKIAGIKKNDLGANTFSSTTSLPFAWWWSYYPVIDHDVKEEGHALRFIVKEAIDPHLSYQLDIETKDGQSFTIPIIKGQTWGADSETNTLNVTPILTNFEHSSNNQLSFNIEPVPFNTLAGWIDVDVRRVFRSNSDKVDANGDGLIDHTSADVLWSRDEKNRRITYHLYDKWRPLISWETYNIILIWDGFSEKILHTFTAK